MRSSANPTLGENRDAITLISIIISTIGRLKLFSSLIALKKSIPHPDVYLQNRVHRCYRDIFCTLSIGSYRRTCIQGPIRLRYHTDEILSSMYKVVTSERHPQVKPWISRPLQLNYSTISLYHHGWPSLFSRFLSFNSTNCFRISNVTLPGFHCPLAPKVIHS